MNEAVETLQVSFAFFSEVLILSPCFEGSAMQPLLNTFNYMG